MSETKKAIKGRTYERDTDGKRFLYTGNPVGEFTTGWEALGPDVYGAILGDPWGWPHRYTIVPQGVKAKVDTTQNKA